MAGSRPQGDDIQGRQFDGSLFSLEVGGATTRTSAPYNLVFVDGHHSFEYAYYDLMRAANYLRPGGVVVVDNVEQAGPAMAVREFLRHYRHWHRFAVAGHQPSWHLPESLPGCCGTILMAPSGIEAGELPCKLNYRNIAVNSISSLRLPVIEGLPKGKLHAHLNLFSMPFDLHIKGKGLVSRNRSVEVQLDGGAGSHIDLRLSPPLAITPEVEAATTNIEIELRFFSAVADGVNMLLDVSRGVTFD